MSEALFEQLAAELREPTSTGIDAGLTADERRDLFHLHAHESPEAFHERHRIEQHCAALRGGTRLDSKPPARFEAWTGLTPQEYRNLRSDREFSLRLPASYRFREVLAFYGRDEQSVSEQVFEDGLRKCVLLQGVPAVLEIRFRGDRAVCHSDAADVFAAHRIAIRVLGFMSDTAAFETRFADDQLLGPLIRKQRGLSIPMAPDAWEALAWAICGQQISVRAAVSLRRELIVAGGIRHPSGLTAHPTAARVAAFSQDELRGLKFSRSKAEYMLLAAQAVASGHAPLDEMRGYSAVRAAAMLRSIRGIGAWTVQYAFLRGIGFGDCLPASDVGLARGFERLLGHRPTALEVEKLMAPYAPYRSLATYHVWASLSAEPGV